MILAIDTSTQWMGLALYDGSQILYEKVWRTNRRHTVELVPSIQNCFIETGLEMSALTAIAVALGPGSFTSMRIGLAVAKGLSLSLHIPVIGIPALDICRLRPAGAGIAFILRSKSRARAFCRPGIPLQRENLGSRRRVADPYAPGIGRARHFTDPHLR